jgi:DNA polymerase III subunit beta
MKTVSAVVDRKAFAPVLTHVRITALDSYRIEIAGTDLVNTITAVVEGGCEEGQAVCLPAKPLLDLCKNAKHVLAFAIDEKNNVRMKLDGVRGVELVGMPAADFPALPCAWWDGAPELSREKFKMMLERVVPTMAVDNGTQPPGRIAALVEMGKGELRVISTDGHRATLVREAVAESEARSMLIPATGVRALIKMLTSYKCETIRVTASETRAYVQAGACTLASRLVDGVFPAYADQIPKVAVHKVCFSRGAMRAAVEQVCAIGKASKKSELCVTLTFSRDAITLTSENPDVGMVTTTVAIDWKGRPFAIGVNARYLLDALSVIDAECVLEMCSPLDPLVFRYGPSCLVATMPMRI